MSQAPFDAAVAAIINGDAAGLRALLEADPDLVRQRSPRPHRSTLLHYVSANGVEDDLQRTPPNIVDIAELLLNAGADINAESEAYGGGSTAVMLAATSVHPEKVGVQIALLKLLLERGARIDVPGSLVNACLANGRGQAAVFLAANGARLDLEGAAGVGRLDMVKSFFDAEGKLQPPATEEQMIDGFNWACQFGHGEVVQYLLDRGLNPGVQQRHGTTGLHWAAFGGHAGLVKLLLEHGAPREAREERFGGTPLDWALYAQRENPASGHSAAVELLRS